MFLASRVALYPIRRQKLANVMSSPATPAPESVQSSLSVCSEKNRLRVQVLDESRTINNFEGRFRTMDLSSTMRSQLLDLSAEVTRLRRLFSDVVYRRELQAMQQ